MHFINEGISICIVYILDKEWKLKCKRTKHVDDMWRHRDIGNITRIYY